MLDWVRSMTNAQMPLEVQELCFRAGDGALLIEDLNLTLSDAGVTAIMGPNGAGKSLLVRLLHGLVPPYSGSIRWQGIPGSDGTRSRQAMVFQKPVLLRRSVAANIDFVLKLKGKVDTVRRNELLAQASLSDRAAQPARALSGGEQQRLALARALASDPEVLFLDEPTASLDPTSTLAIETSIRAASLRGVKIILVTHDAGQARRLSGDVVFMHLGKVVEHSSADVFFTKPTCHVSRDYLAGRLVV